MIYLAKIIIEWGWVGYEELCRSGTVLSIEICRILHILWKPNSLIALIYYSLIYSFRHFTLCLITQPHPQVFEVNGSITCSGLHFWHCFSISDSIWQNFWCHWVNRTKVSPNVVNSSWFWWIMHVVLTNQEKGNILNE